MKFKPNTNYEKDSKRIARYINNIIYDVEKITYRGNPINDWHVEHGKTKRNLLEKLMHDPLPEYLRRLLYRIQSTAPSYTGIHLLLQGLLLVEKINYPRGGPSSIFTPTFNPSSDVNAARYSRSLDFISPTIYSDCMYANTRCIPLDKFRARYWKSKIEKISNALEVQIAEESKKSKRKKKR